MVEKPGGEGVVREIKRRTRRKYSSEEKIRIVLEGLRGEMSIAELCRKEGIRRTCTTPGARTSWKPGRNDSKATQPGRRPVARWWKI